MDWWAPGDILGVPLSYLNAFVYDHALASNGFWQKNYSR